LEAKFGQHLPLNRQSESFAQEGIELDVSTLADWVGACTATLSPLVALLRAHVLAGERLHGDDTTVPVLATGRTTIGRLWVYVRDDRPFAGPAPPAALFHYSPDRKAEHPRRHLYGWQGILQADAYAGFNELYAPDRHPGPVIAAGCWAHARRKFFDLAELGRAPLAVEAVRRIDALFAIERHLTGLSAGERLAQRQQRSALHLTELEAWMRETRAKLSRHADVDPLGELRPLPRRRPDGPVEQRRRTSPARHRHRPEGLAVRRLRPRWRTRRGSLLPDHNRQAQRC
jgi:hypothetical protein